ncbi:hypothetical protein PVL29_011834 [Vitis rotundifolia]|uniref:Helicase ATP-binding domain-containing protein n=1 Tax=Vitis rotundifolia TaxID=103349 RepID=A0AA38ZPI7_VITRO|nr:hypothetical protein PVL29_011832 [Vitis rotundifolia]KAJ9692912.1 hypothetical protein PVL29_011834 [Vitis rotundifolia]
MLRPLYRIHQGVEPIVGTPGRLIDLLSKHGIELDDAFMLVLDEVDCKLQRSFRDQVMQIFRVPSQSQVLIYSATISREAEKVASSMAEDTIVISAGRSNCPIRAAKQLAIWVESQGTDASGQWQLSLQILPNGGCRKEEIQGQNAPKYKRPI